MKKLVFGLSAILLCFIMASCSSPTSKLESLIEDIKENGNDWDEDQWDEAQVKVAEILIAFAESDPSKEEYKEFRKVTQKLGKAFAKIDDKDAIKAMREAEKNFEENHGDLNDELEKAEKKLKKIAKKYDKDDDDDDADDDDDYSDDDD